MGMRNYSVKEKQGKLLCTFYKFFLCSLKIDLGDHGKQSTSWAGREHGLSIRTNELLSVCV